MKLRSFAMVALLSLLAASFSTAVLADDPSDNNDAAAVQPQQAAPSDNNIPNSIAQNNDAAVPGDNTISADQPTPDTATGDDDY
jgi:hypothetical protein